MNCFSLAKLASYPCCYSVDVRQIHFIYFFYIYIYLFSFSFCYDLPFVRVQMFAFLIKSFLIPTLPFKNVAFVVLSFRVSAHPFSW